MSLLFWRHCGYVPHMLAADYFRESQEHFERGDHSHAFAACRQALRLDPGNLKYRLRLAYLLRHVKSFAGADLALFDDLMAVVELQNVDLRFVIGPILSALTYHPEIERLMLLSLGAPLDYADAAERLANIPLILRLMHLTTLPNHDIERFLVGLRRRLLEMLDASPNGLPFSAALAAQCFLNEYVIGPQRVVQVEC